MEMTKQVNIKKNVLIFSLIALLLGIIQVFAPEFVLKVLDYLVGVCILILGIFNIILYKKNRIKNISTNNLSYGIILLVLGVYFLTHKGFVVGIMALVFGFYIMVNGIFGIQFSFESKNKGFEKWKVLLIMSIINFILGVIVLFLPIQSSLVLIFWNGIFMILSAVINLVVLIINKRSLKEGPEEREEIITE